MHNQKRVIITRSAEGNRSLANLLKEKGMEPILVNTIRLQPPKTWRHIDESIAKLNEYDWLIFTSGAGAAFFAERFRKLGTKNTSRIAAVGPGTAAKLRSLGFSVDFIPTTYTTRKLAEELPDTYGRKVVAFRSNLGSAKMKKILIRRGFLIKQLSIYKTIFTDCDLRGREELGGDLIIFASSSAVNSLCRICDKMKLKELKKVPVLCIGPVTARQARLRGFERIYVCNNQTLDSVVSDAEAILNGVIKQ